jgi:phosphocarrier protein
LTELPMSQQTSISRRQVEIINALGLHLRPANQFVKLAEQFEAEIKVHHGDRVCNGKSIMDMMLLAAEQGSRLELEATGPDAEAALSALAGLVAARFHETDDGWAADPAP